MASATGGLTSSAYRGGGNRTVTLRRAGRRFSRAPTGDFKAVRIRPCGCRQVSCPRSPPAISSASSASSSARTMLPVAEATRGCPDDRGDCRKNPANLLGVDLEVAYSGQIEGVRDWWCVDGDKRGDAHEHQRLRVEARRLDRSRGHTCEQVEDRGLGCPCHGSSFRKVWNANWRPRPSEPFLRGHTPPRGPTFHRPDRTKDGSRLGA